MINGNLKNRISKKIEIRETAETGKGMFAREKITKGEELITWIKGYTDREGARLAQAEGKGFMQWDDDIFSIEDGDDDMDYSINHSCDSNTWMKDAYTLTARHNIEVNEEITADYALWEANENHISLWECKCSSPECRKRITGKDWLLPELQARYKDHFSPLINKRINKIGKEMIHLWNLTDRLPHDNVNRTG